MTGAVLVRLGEAWLLCAGIQLLLWVIQERTRNAGIVDIGWAGSFTAIAGLFGMTAASERASFLPIGIVVVVWSTRLATYLVTRGAATGREEGRYAALRSKWGRSASKKFLIFFQAQGALAAVLSSAFVIPFILEPWDSGGVRATGLALAVVGVVGETLADLQLAQWKREPVNRGRVCDTGLWNYSRHPNYFFEWTVWVGFAIYSLAFHGGWIALAGQALIFGTIWKVTGIPATEAQAVRSKGEAYRQYQATTSAFIPLPKRR